MSNERTSLALKVLDRIEAEIIECDKDYDRYQIPCDWNNVGISDSITRIFRDLIGETKPDYIHMPKGGMYDLLENN